jgi:hypothetical protein
VSGGAKRTPSEYWAAGCPQITAGKVMDLCGVYYSDRVAR